MQQLTSSHRLSWVLVWIICFIYMLGFVPDVCADKSHKKVSTTHARKVTSPPSPRNKTATKVDSRKVKTLDPTTLKKTISTVLQHLPNVEDNPGVRALIYETIIVESGMEKDAKAYKGAHGSIQMQLGTAKALLKWLKENHPKTHIAVMDYCDKKLSLRDNLSRNMRFQIAMCATYYWHREPNLEKKVGTQQARSKLWKKEYNTYKGKGTPKKYLKRCEVAQVLAKKS